jgi:hypothetical protein
MEEVGSPAFPQATPGIVQRGLGGLAFQVWSELLEEILHLMVNLVAGH